MMQTNLFPFFYLVLAHFYWKAQDQNLNSFVLLHYFNACYLQSIIFGIDWHDVTFPLLFIKCHQLFKVVVVFCP